MIIVLDMDRGKAPGNVGVVKRLFGCSKQLRYRAAPCKRAFSRHFGPGPRM